MEITIKVLRPGVAWSMKTEVDDDTIITRIFVIARTSVNTAVCTNYESYSFSVPDWERSVRRHLEQITMGNVIVETRMKCSLHASDTERKIQDLVCQILGISNR